jgi:hypothetical protein
MRPLLQWSGAVLVVLSAGVLFDTRRAVPAATIPASLTASIHPAHTLGARLTLGEPVRAAVLLQAADCTGNLRILHLLNRRGVREGLQLSVIWYVGPAEDSMTIRPLLPSWAAQVPLRTAPPSVVKERARLGHTSTPLLVVLDQEGRVRFTSQSPRSSREFAGLRRIVEGLTWFEDR